MIVLGTSPIYAMADTQHLSLVDCASFVVMRLYGISDALAFDADFEQEGYSLHV